MPLNVDHAGWKERLLREERIHQMMSASMIGKEGDWPFAKDDSIPPLHDIHNSPLAFLPREASQRAPIGGLLRSESAPGPLGAGSEAGSRRASRAPTGASGYGSRAGGRSAASGRSAAPSGSACESIREEIEKTVKDQVAKALAGGARTPLQGAPTRRKRLEDLLRLAGGQVVKPPAAKAAGPARALAAAA
mmetsp:Transcript_44063/g.118058  ORF Transcript_44063/g.118058 Transcript_44063/m.118058 type:complete len:191 (-) Transcript_44063:10-582(-)